jgi:hypothetical protein
MLQGQDRSNGRSPVEIQVNVTTGAVLVEAAGLPTALGPAPIEESLSVCRPEPVPAVALKAVATLAGAGAYDADPAVGDCVAIPAGVLKATIMISYTRAAANGQAAHKVFLSDGTSVGQALSPDGSYNGVVGRLSTSASAIVYTISVDVSGGSTKLGIASAEVGVTGSPGSVVSSVTFG